MKVLKIKNILNESLDNVIFKFDNKSFKTYIKNNRIIQILLNLKFTMLCISKTKTACAGITTYVWNPKQAVGIILFTSLTQQYNFYVYY